MVFLSQENSFLKEYESKVESLLEEQAGKFEVICSDSIFFPEGGGQPSDSGAFIIDNESYLVKDVVRRNDKVVHIFDKPVKFNVGDEVLQKIDWDNRFNNMQQHSGQHLISALFEKEFNYQTKSWWLGSETSYIELDSDVKQSEVDSIEKMANDCISKGIKVFVDIYKNAEDAGEEVTRASKGLPLDLAGPIRVIRIDGIDSNMCCGTHINSLAQLQVVKFLNIEKSKGRVFVHFLVGNRVIKKLNAAFQRETELNALLNGGPDSHKDLIKKLQTTAKSNQKTIQKLSKEVAATIAEKLNSQESPPPYFCLHRTDGVEVDFSNMFLKSLKLKKPILLFMTISDGIDSKSGSLILQGDPNDDLPALFDEICKILDGKGNGKGNRYQAKVTKLNKVKDCDAVIKKYFENKNV